MCSGSPHTSLLLLPSPAWSPPFPQSWVAAGPRDVHLPSRVPALRPSAGGPPSEGDTSRNTRLALQSKSRKAKKWLGQHYMVDDGVTLATVEIAGVEPADVVLEVGPGTGVLTEALLTKGAYVIAVEKDKDMVDITSERLLPCDSLEVVHGDVMKWPLEKHIHEALQKRGQQRAKVVANLPYNITTDFLQRLLPLASLFSTAVLMLQDEAARRLVEAGPGSQDYRKMNILVNLFSEPTYALFVDRRKYLPPPKFHGAVVKFDLKDPSQIPHLVSLESFLNLLNRSFEFKRKMLRSSLARYYSPGLIEAALTSLHLPPTARPEELSLEHFIQLHRLLADAEKKHLR